MISDEQRADSVRILLRAAVFFTRAQSQSKEEMATWAEAFGFALGSLGVSADEVQSSLEAAWDDHAEADWQRVMG